MSTEKREKMSADTDMPYEKFLQKGPESLTDAELLAIIIRTGNGSNTPTELGRQILQLSPVRKGLLGLHHLSVRDLMQLHGIGEVKAVKIKCISELSNRLARSTAETVLSWDKPSTIAKYYMENLRHCETERVLLVMLDNKNRLIEECMISQGTVNASLVSPREVLLKALRCNATYIILLHNHPSGDPAPGRQDMLITQKIKEAAAFVEIPLIDHIIIGDNKYVSFREKNLL